MARTPHIRILRHYIHTPYLILAIAEFTIIVGCVYLAYRIRLSGFPPEPRLLLPSALSYSLLAIVGMVSMGVYEARGQEGFTGMMLRSAVGIFLIGGLGAAIVFYIFPNLAFGRGVLSVAAIVSFVAVFSFRLIAVQFIDEENLKKRVLVLGTGHRALKISTRMRRSYDRRGFNIVSYASMQGAQDLVTGQGEPVTLLEEPLDTLCERLAIDEVVVALDERRRNRDSGGGLPLEELFECRLRGINVCDIQEFFERESGKIVLELLQPAWMVFSDGFVQGIWRNASKRMLDILASTTLLILTWPFMTITALAIFIESGFKGPILYRQLRVGLNGKNISVLKFRSMRTDAEVDGKAVWASQNDPRITRVGSLIRKTRIDELPQIFNVLTGNMSFVGPRPERPEFVKDLEQDLPYYTHRHRVKPGITGWAQLCYPYGASLEDAKEKLQYDLYYLKNNSILLDLIILIQTVQVVLIGDGAR